MAKVIICDVCHKVIDDPYLAQMREFCIGVEFDHYGHSLPCRYKNKKKIHLCNECYKGFVKMQSKEEE